VAQTTGTIPIFLQTRAPGTQSSGSLELTGRSPQPFLPEKPYVSRTLPTRSPAELQAFLNHCQYLLQNRPNRLVQHYLTELHEITPNPVDFLGFLWRYKVIISASGVFEDYRRLVHFAPDHVTTERAYTVYYHWTDQSYTVTLV
jgi:hypothetical protein